MECKFIVFMLTMILHGMCTNLRKNHLAVLTTRWPHQNKQRYFLVKSVWISSNASAGAMAPGCWITIPAAVDARLTEDVMS